MNHSEVISQVSKSNSKNHKISDKKGNFRVGEITRATVDSGACTTIAPPSSFPNTPSFWTPKVGRVYGACGGEVVKNIGTKTVNYETENHMNYSIDFEVGDKITKPLIAVSEQCSRGRGVFFGPGPKFEAYIVHDPDVFCCYKGPITPIYLRNGTYEIDIREKYVTQIGGFDDDSSVDENSGPGGDSIELVPDGAPEPGVADKIPVVEPISEPLVDNRKTPHEGAVTDPYSSPCHESVPVRLLNAPSAPTQQQIDEHNASMHIPYRSWCPICVLSLIHI